jgi:hypothetical protein
MRDQGYIVLYNPISHEGHLDSWHLLCADLLLRAGWGIVMLTTDPRQIQIKSTQRGLNNYDRFVLMGTKPPTEGARGKLREMLKRFDSYLDTHPIGKGPAGQFFSSLRGLAASLRRVRQSLPANTWVTHVDPALFQSHANFAISAQPVKVRAVFNMYIDAYSSDLTAWTDFALTNGVPWMGLCITPRQGNLEPYYADPSYKGTCFLDPKVCQQYSRMLPNKHFAYLPDITETALPETTSPLALEILQRARGRPIVFMGGSIGKQKNLACWYGLIKQANPEEWFFLQVGRLNKNNLTKNDEAALLEVQRNTPENLFVNAEYINDERFFNELISISTVVFAVYRDFERSSNMLSKAAAFGKPIVVSDEFLMGERVRRYGIGQVVHQDNVSQMYQALQQCRLSPPHESAYAAYRQDFCEAAMQQALDQFMRACLTKESDH